MSVVETERPLPLPEPAIEHGLRLLPAPDCEPPYDDERPGGRPLPLRPASLRTPPPLRLVPPLEDDRTSSTPADLPPVRPFAQAMVQRLIEVAAGLRPLGQLQRDTTLEVYDTLDAQLAARPRSAGPRPNGRSIRSVHVQEQPGGVAEVFATVRRGGRYAALAFRLEGRAGRWQCTELAGF